MELSLLRVIHQLQPCKGATPGAPYEFKVPSEAFVLNTCQRKVVIFSADSSFQSADFSGVQAYAFLLRLICGLESELQGETEILGQFKAAWNRFEDKASEQSDALSPWIHKILMDAKEVRARELQNLGSQSYGSLVRKVIRERSLGLRTKKKILLIGAGHLAREILPWILNDQSEVSVWNRSSERLVDLKKEFSAIQVLDSEKAAWSEADFAIACIPFNRTQDAERVKSWSENTAPHRALIHLGGSRCDSGDFQILPSFFALDDVLQLQEKQSHARREQINRALRVCKEKAHLRSMSTGSLSLPHGWEDLAVFAAL